LEEIWESTCAHGERKVWTRFTNIGRLL
jgi:hypothetical protein